MDDELYLLKINKLREVGRKMREAQQLYFKLRSHSTLQASMKLEREYDYREKELQEIENKRVTQKQVELNSEQSSLF